MENTQENKNNINWKKLLNIVLRNNKVLLKYKIDVEDKKLNLNLLTDINSTKNLILSTLKNFFTLPKLRRSNYHLESEINNSHQTFNFDVLGEQEDLYRSDGNLVLKKNLPFSELLRNFSMILDSFRYDEEGKRRIGNIRWYNLDNFETKNPILLIFKEIIIQIVTFCYVSLNYIQKYDCPENIPFVNIFDVNDVWLKCKFNEKEKSKEEKIRLILDYLFLNEYNKRRKAFFESAIHLDSQFENLNVFLNYLYEKLFCGFAINPKFSIYRLMVTIWNKVVLSNLMNSSNLAKKTAGMLEFYTDEKLNNNYRDECKKALIEDIISSIFDFDCNEYSSIYQNLSTFNVSEKYLNLEENVISSFNEVIINKMKNTSSLEEKKEIWQKLMEYGFGISLPVRTEKKLKRKTSEIYTDFIFWAIYENFANYLQNNQFSNENVEKFYLANEMEASYLQISFELNLQKEEIICIAQKLHSVAMQMFRNPNISEYAVFSFLSSLRKRENQCINRLMQELGLITALLNDKFENYNMNNDKITRIIQNKIFNLRSYPKYLHPNLLKYETQDLSYIEQISLNTTETKTKLPYMPKKEVSSPSFTRVKSGESISTQGSSTENFIYDDIEMAFS